MPPNGSCPWFTTNFAIQPSPGQTGRFELTFRPWMEGRIYTLLAGSSFNASLLVPVATAFTNHATAKGSFAVTNTMQPVQFFRLQIGLP